MFSTEMRWLFVGLLEKVLGPEHPRVAQSLENYAALLRKTGRYAEAARLETCALSIQLQGNTGQTQKEDGAPDYRRHDYYIFQVAVF